MIKDYPQSSTGCSCVHDRAADAHPHICIIKSILIEENQADEGHHLTAGAVPNHGCLLSSTFLDDNNNLHSSTGSSCVHDRAADAHEPPCCRGCVLLHVSAAVLRLLLRRHSSRRLLTASSGSSCGHARAAELQS